MIDRIDGRVSQRNLEAKIHGAKMKWFFVAAAIASTVNLPLGAALLVGAAYQYYKWNGIRNSS